MTIPLNDTSAMVMSIMIGTFEALLIFLLFFPGFLTERIIRALTPKRPKTSFEMLIDAAALSVGIFGLHLLVACVFHLPVVPVSVGTTHALLYSSVSIDWRSVASILLISVALGLKLGKWLDNGALYRRLRGIWVAKPSPDLARSQKRGARARFWVRSFVWRLIGEGSHFSKWTRHTRGTGNDTVWGDIFSSPVPRSACVRLKSGRRIIGRCRLYSDSLDARELLVIPPSESIIPGEDPRVLILEVGETSPKRLKVVGQEKADKIVRDITEGREPGWLEKRGVADEAPRQNLSQDEQQAILDYLGIDVSKPK